MLEFSVSLPSSLTLAMLDRRDVFREAAFRFALGFLSGRPAVAWVLTADQFAAMLLVPAGSGVLARRDVVT
jgi:hypothetical protein